jgi:hypothetical protein
MKNEVGSIISIIWKTLGRIQTRKNLKKSQQGHYPPHSVFLTRTLEKTNVTMAKILNTLFYGRILECFETQ